MGPKRMHQQQEPGTRLTFTYANQSSRQNSSSRSPSLSLSCCLCLCLCLGLCLCLHRCLRRVWVLAHTENTLTECDIAYLHRVCTYTYVIYPWVFNHYSNYDGLIWPLSETAVISRSRSHSHSHLPCPVPGGINA